MLFNSNAGGFLEAGDVWVNSDPDFSFYLPPCWPLCCPECGDTNDTTVTNYVSDPSPWTVGLPVELGGGTLSAQLSGSFQIVAANNLPAQTAATLGSSAIPIVLTAYNKTAANSSSNNPAGELQAVDNTGFFGPAGANVYLSPVQIRP